ncbi:MAG TPA: hypothetical protein DEP42_05590 [Ruminococcaceae bacterium]|nr:hypothetical protein [Oscillospiraceae bacterium]
MFGLLVLLLLVGIFGYAIKTYNGLRFRSEGVKRSNSDLIGMLRKRVTLVNQLIDICKGYGEHEKLTHITVSEGATNVAESASIARAANTVIDRVTAIASNFPDLKANRTYEKLMDQLHSIEGEIQEKRELYNRTVELYNTQRATFPAVLFSDTLGFPEAPYYQTNEDGLDAKIEFKTDDGAILRETMKRIGDNATERGKLLAQRAGAQIENFREVKNASNFHENDQDKDDENSK